ncbi:beta-ribofuranosylaminobenzene 5'-phosphate synthase [Methermicoccus shengliensis]|uniref:beta-ribofuranosylaminobenzene 5'-phosphate synthase n=1 Tax=Methermicoccus shengliensis TaxID=660064 RepID=UPI000B2418BE
MMITVRSCSRVHLSLLDLNGSLGRVDGGVGIALQEPYIEVVAEPSEGLDICIAVEMDDTERAVFENRMRLVAQSVGLGNATLTLTSAYPQHVGLGCGTQLALCTAAALCTLHGTCPPARRIAQMVGRGGTSGIGVAAFEHGGFIVDAGHLLSQKGAFAPSAASRAPPPPILARYDFPDWDIVLAIPNLKGASDAKEVDIFAKYCPIDELEVARACRLVLMKMMPAVLEDDLVAFGEALNMLQGVGFKRIEVGLQAERVREIMDVMLDSGAAGAGMSSFGPTIVGVCEHGKRVKRGVERALSEDGGRVVLTRAKNSGASITES